MSCQQCTVTSTAARLWLEPLPHMDCPTPHSTGAWRIHCDSGNRHLQPLCKRWTVVHEHPCGATVLSRLCLAELAAPDAGQTSHLALDALGHALFHSRHARRALLWRPGLAFGLELAPGLQQHHRLLLCIRLRLSEAAVRTLVHAAGDTPCGGVRSCACRASMHARCPTRILLQQRTQTWP